MCAARTAPPQFISLVGWLKLYNEQIKNYEKEIYDLNLKLYFSTASTATASSATTTAAIAIASTQPQFKSLADYFDYMKNQE
jgi:hypothetical protein